MRKYILVLLSLLLLPAIAIGQATYTAHLSKILLPDTAQYHGSKVITFAKPVEGIITVPSEWGAVEMATIGENPRLQPAIAVRYRNDSGGVTYAISNNGTGVFDAASILQFHQSGDRSIAYFQMTVLPDETNDSSDNYMSCQLVLSKNRVIARLGECREGVLRLGDSEYGVRLYAPSINNPFYEISSDGVCLIDANRDGAYSWKWRINDADRSLVSSERMALEKPFSINGSKLKVASIDAAGTIFTCADYPADTAAVVGFLAPEFAVTDLAGNSHSLSDMKDHIVLITFWSARCPYCEKIRPSLDSLVSHCDTTRFIAISATTDSNVGKIEEILQQKPYYGIIAPYEPQFWQVFNARKTTPVYVIIDRDGSILFTGSGASAFSIVDQIVLTKLSQD
ncbi:MAG: TlpA disulfide reductase family protein [Candidatus Zixiibacteriota bacterium]